jgi:phospholipid-binding lipoprotein MlaA
MRRYRVLRATLLATTLSLLTAGAAFAQSPAADPAQAAPPPAAAPAPATAPAPGDTGALAPNADPYEHFNRKSYGLFVWLDSHAIRPVSVFYGHAVPSPLRTGFHNVLRNVNTPVIFFNDVLQLHPKAAGETLGRFALNSTVGLAGLADVATEAGIPYHNNGFGNTLGRYGVPPGPFIFIPVLGPSDVRDIFGYGIDSVSDPLTWINYTGRWEVSASRTLIGGVDTRWNADPQLKQIDSMATDRYATLRSLYLQNRAAEVNGGKVNVQALPDFGPDVSAPASTPATPGSNAPSTQPETPQSTPETPPPASPQPDAGPHD